MSCPECDLLRPLAEAAIRYAELMSNPTSPMEQIVAADDALVEAVETYKAARG